MITVPVVLSLLWVSSKLVNRRKRPRGGGRRRRLRVSRRSFVEDPEGSRGQRTYEQVLTKRPVEGRFVIYFITNGPHCALR